MIRFGLILGGLLLATACSGPASTQPPVSVGKQFTMRVDNLMQFATPALNVQAGKRFELTLENVGSMPHDFTFSDGVSQPVKIAAKACAPRFRYDCPQAWHTRRSPSSSAASTPNSP